MEIGRWVHIGDKNTIRCHEGSLRFGDKVVLGRDNVINTYIDIELGDSVLMADWVYVCDFDHRMDDINLPIKDQGILKGPVRIGPDTWIATKVTILRNTTVGRGCVLGSHAVVKGDIPDYLDRGRCAGQGRQEPQAGVGDLGRRARRAGRRAGRHRAQEGLALVRPSGDRACLRLTRREIMRKPARSRRRDGDDIDVSDRCVACGDQSCVRAHDSATRAAHPLPSHAGSPSTSK